eukprot:TRINITY_DN2824_c3_g1_i1.p1 TRINITY_DN2824_c3_g1~~TRINITY_DN2824_c3_g1_i1.p1  ORF type:complete len:257 (+),score=53.90 TRINITY_DN2824_c3_g1_i1:37-807(+)
MSYANSYYSGHGGGAGYANQSQSYRERDQTHSKDGDRSSVMGGNTMDFKPIPAIDEMDPSLSDGHRTLYNREVPFELRTQESAEKPNDVGTTEGVKVKVLAMGEESGPTSLRIELSSECDLFFQYTCNINQHGYEDLKHEQDLQCDLKDFTHTLMRMLNKCIKESTSYALLILQREGNAVLQFIQNMEYKFVQLLQLPFKESPEFVIRQQISYRYNALKARLSMMQARLQDVNALVKVKNPSLLLQLQRSYEDTYQ